MTSESLLIRHSDRLADAWAPPPKLNVSEWAGQFRYLSPESSAEPGVWQNARAPHLVAPMDRLSPSDPAERVVCKFSSQSGKSELLLNFCGFIAHLDPGPTLILQPNTAPMAETFSKDRIAPMLRDSPVLTELVSERKGRGAADTMLHKAVPGGHWTIAGANSPSSLASRPIRFLLADELDRWAATKEGDALLLGRKRLQTFRVRRRSKELIVSSPTYDDLGISVEYDACEQHWEWHLGCLHCEGTQRPQLKHFQCDDEDPRTLRYACEHCGGIHTLKDEAQVKLRGQWVCTKDDGELVVGYWFNQWASPFARWDDTLAEWLEAQGDPAKQQVVTNTCMAEGWGGEGERVEPHILRNREEEYPAEVPDAAAVITIGADLQVDRIEAEVVAWAPNRESWSLDYVVIPGEPTDEQTWDELLDLYRTSYKHASGVILKPSAMCVDSGAWTSTVYEFVKRTRDGHVFPIKGIAGWHRDAVDNDLRALRKRTAKRLRSCKPAELIGVDVLKRLVYTYLSAEPDAPGYCHFPIGRTDDYYQQLTGERLTVVAHRGKRPERRWTPIVPNVEALDCRVYALAALLLLGPDRVRPVVREEDRRQPKKPQQRPASPFGTERWSGFGQQRKPWIIR